MYLVRLSPEVPAPHDIFSGGLSPESSGYEDLLRGRLPSDWVATARLRGGRSGPFAAI